MSATSAIEHVDLSSNVSVAVARKALDTQRQQGDAAVSLLEQAVELSDKLGNQARAEAAQSRGGVDVYA